MPEPIEPSHTDAAHDTPPPAADDRDKTKPAAQPVGPMEQFGPPAAPDEIGTLGPYRILKQLGKGGMGAVYLAIDTRLDRKLALKVMRPEVAADAEAKERFLREGRAAAQITHDNVVVVHEADEREGMPYIAMQLLRGYPLDQYLKTKGAPPLPHVLRIARETALGLAAAHAQGLVHRDIKPANLWLEAPNGRVKVLDFGLVKPASDPKLTRSGAVLGTPSYMSLEQARGVKVDHRTDLFSLGAVLYRLCTGKAPFTGPSVMAVLVALGNDDPTPVRDLNPNVPEALAALIHQLLSKRPEDRPQTAAEVAKRLRALTDQLVAVPPAVAVAVPPVPPSTDRSGSQPVVIHPLPLQPPAVVPMSVSTQPEGAFAESDAGGAETERTTDGSAPKRARSGRRLGLLVAGVAALLVVSAVAVVALTTGRTPGLETKAPPDEKPEPPKAPAPLAPTFTSPSGIEFVKVPKGTAWLGRGSNPPDEKAVVIEQDFYLGKYEVTQEEWEKVMGTNPSVFSRTGASAGAVASVSNADLKRFPIESVTWNDCQLFIGRLNTKEPGTGWVYRLPKEAEWEYACRGGPGDKLAGAYDYYLAKPANAMSWDQANFAPGGGKGLRRTSRVGSYDPNPLGLFDMHGNVWEWCADSDPLNGVPGRGRVYRGGSWNGNPWGCRAVSRGASAPSYRADNVGLRVARVPDGNDGAGK